MRCQSSRRDLLGQKRESCASIMMVDHETPKLVLINHLAWRSHLNVGGAVHGTLTRRGPLSDDNRLGRTTPRFPLSPLFSLVKGAARSESSSSRSTSECLESTSTAVIHVHSPRWRFFQRKLGRECGRAGEIALATALAKFHCDCSCRHHEPL